MAYEPVDEQTLFTAQTANGNSDHARIGRKFGGQKRTLYCYGVFDSAVIKVMATGDDVDPNDATAVAAANWHETGIEITATGSANATPAPVDLDFNATLLRLNLSGVTANTSLGARII